MYKIYKETDKYYLVRLIVELKDGRVGGVFVWIPKEYKDNPEGFIDKRINLIVYKNQELIQSYHLQSESEPPYEYLSGLLYRKDNIIDGNHGYKKVSGSWNVFSYCDSGGLYLSFWTNKVKFYSLIKIQKDGKYFIIESPPIIEVYEFGDDLNGRFYRVELYYPDKDIKTRLEGIGINCDNDISEYISIINL